MDNNNNPLKNNTQDNTISKDDKKDLGIGKEKTNDAWEATKDFSKNIFEKAKEKTSEAITTVKDPVFQEKVKEKTHNAWEATKDFTGHAYEKAKEKTNEAIVTVKDPEFSQKVKNGLYDFAEGVKSTSKRVVDYLNDDGTPKDPNIKPDGSPQI